MRQQSDSNAGGGGTKRVASAADESGPESAK